jgi:hypothetical protein
MIAMPPQEVIEGLLEDVHDQGMSPSGIVPADFTQDPPAILALARAAARLGLGMGKPQLAKWTESGELFPQRSVLHFADFSTHVPALVDEWKLQIGDLAFDLCLVGATRPLFAARMGMPAGLIAVFQICEHDADCFMRLRGDTNSIGYYDISPGGQQPALLEYILLTFVKEGLPSTGVLTILSTEEYRGVSATLVLKPICIEREYSLEEVK